MYSESQEVPSATHTPSGSLVDVNGALIGHYVIESFTTIAAPLGF
jgi:hypothetical protein